MGLILMHLTLRLRLVVDSEMFHARKIFLFYKKKGKQIFNGDLKYLKMKIFHRNDNSDFPVAPSALRRSASPG